MTDIGILFKAAMVQAILNTQCTAGSITPIDPTRPCKSQTRRVVKFRARTPRDFQLKDTPHHWPQSSAHVDGGGNWIFWSDDSPGNAELTKRAYPNGEGIRCPYGRVGDHLWVRETWQAEPGTEYEFGDWVEDVPPAFRKSADVYMNTYYRADMSQYMVLYYNGYDGPCVDLQPTHQDITKLSQFDKLKWRSPLFMPRWASRLTLPIISVQPQRLQDITEADAILEGVAPNWLPGVPGWSPVEHGYYDYSLPEDWDGEGASCLTAVESYATLWNSINAQPKPMSGGRTQNAYYISYPWEDIRATDTYRGRPHYVIGNPWVWRVQFERQQQPAANSRKRLTMG